MCDEVCDELFVVHTVGDAVASCFDVFGEVFDLCPSCEGVFVGGDVELVELCDDGVDGALGCDVDVDGLFVGGAEVGFDVGVELVCRYECYDADDSDG